MIDRLERHLTTFDRIEPNHLHKYMLIEDLGRKYECPCVMDVKIGTRNYGDFASPDKIRRQMLKTESTTSASLGIRLCGYKVWCRKTKSTREVDKYEHRKLNNETLLISLYSFFSNGTKLRTSIIKQFLVKLEKLLQVIETNQPYRVYSSSLLFMFEGAKKERTPEVTLKMIDFAHTYSFREGQKQDDGYKLGLINLIDCLEKVVKMKQKHKVQRSSESEMMAENAAQVLWAF